MWNIKVSEEIDSTKKSDLTPVYIIDTVNNLIKRLQNDLVIGNDEISNETKMNATLIFSASLK